MGVRSEQTELREPTSLGLTAGDTITTPSSLLRLSPGFVLAVIAIADAGRFADPDLWWHLITGETVLRAGHLIMREPFSYSAHGLYWVDHERIAEVIMALAYRAGGIVGLKLFKLACTAVTFILITLTIAETGASRPIQSCVLILAAVGLGPTIQFRPQLFTFICFSALMLLLTRHNYGRKKQLWLIVPLMFVWADLHGGYVVGLAMLGLYGGAAIARAAYDRENLWSDVITFGALWLFAFAATLVSPFGLSKLWAVLHTMSNPMTRELIREWQPLFTVMLPSLHQNPSSAVLYGVILGSMAAFIIMELLTPTLDDMPLALIAGVGIAAAIAVIRNVEIAIIALPSPLAHHAALICERPQGGRAPSVRARSKPDNGYISSQAILAGIGIVVLLTTGLCSSRLTTSIPMPLGAVNFMKSRRLTGNILCDFNWGGYVIFHLTPRSRVFIDGRYDEVYSDAIIDQYLQFLRDEPGANRVLDEWPHDFVLIPPKWPAWRLMVSRKDWKLIYRDPTCGLFARFNSAAANVPGLPVIGMARTSYFP